MEIIVMIKLFLYVAIEIYSTLLVIYVLSSYFPNIQETRFYNFLSNLYEPVLEKLSFLRIGPISFAAVGLLILLQVLSALILAV